LILEGAYAVGKSIRKSSIRLPDLSWAVNQRGFFPRQTRSAALSGESGTYAAVCGVILLELPTCADLCVREALAGYGPRLELGPGIGRQ
jgi:hypothetical protein